MGVKQWHRSQAKASRATVCLQANDIVIIFLLSLTRNRKDKVPHCKRCHRNHRVIEFWESLLEIIIDLLNDMQSWDVQMEIQARDGSNLTETDLCILKHQVGV